MLIILSIVLLAALLNLGVAWLIAWQFNRPHVAYMQQAVRQDCENGITLDGMLERGLLTQRMQVANVTGAAIGPGRHGDRRLFLADLPSHWRSEVLAWCGSLESPAPRSTALVVTARAWPWPAFYLVDEIVASTWSKQPGDNRIVRGGWIVRPPSRQQPDPIQLPYLPMWGGFLLNMAVVYVPLVGLAFANLSLFRQWNRYRRGRCPRCGYDLRGRFDQGCSECGWRRAAPSD